MSSLLADNGQPIQKEVYWEGVLEKDSMWCYAEQGSYKMKLREVYKDYNRFKSLSKKLNNWVRENFSKEKQYAKVCDQIIQQDLYAEDLFHLYSDIVNKFQLLQMISNSFDLGLTIDEFQTENICD